MSNSEAKSLLDTLRVQNKPVMPRKIGLIGREGFGGFTGYAFDAGTFRAQEAELPYVVEAFAVCFSKSKKHLQVDTRTYLNRSPALHGIQLTGSAGRIANLTGAGLYKSLELGGGNYKLFLSVISPYVPLLSDGKVPDLLRMRTSVVEVIEKAARAARKLAPDDEDETAERAEMIRRQRAAKEAAEGRRAVARTTREREQEEWLQLPGPRRLLRTMEEEQARTGLSIDALTAMSEKADPFRQDTAANYRVGSWLADQIERLVKPGQQVHLRGLHYRLVAKGGVIRPDGTRYLNTLQCWSWLIGAAKAARWNGLVPFSAIVDERNAAPVWAPVRVTEGEEPSRTIIEADELLPSLSPLEQLLPTIRLAWSQAATRQAYHLCFLGEKLSLRPVLAPLSKEYDADLLLPSGEPSETMIKGLWHRSAQAAGTPGYGRVGA